MWVAIQTIVGQVNSEFSGTCYEDDSSGSIQQTCRRLRLGDRWRKGQTMAKNPKVSK